MGSYTPGPPSFSGTVVLDFGNTPTATGETIVTGQLGITTVSRIRTWLSNQRSMSDNDQDSHLMAGTFLKLVAGNVTPGAGFTIYAASMVGLVTGAFRVDWIWSS